MTMATSMGLELELEVASRAAVSELARSVCFAIGQGLARGAGRGTGMSVSWQGHSASPSGGGVGWRRERAGRAGGRASKWKGLVRPPQMAVCTQRSREAMCRFKF